MELESEYSFVRYYIYIYIYIYILLHSFSSQCTPSSPPHPPPPNPISKEIPYYLGTFDTNYIVFRNIENFQKNNFKNQIIFYIKKENIEFSRIFYFSN
jgi:hypothetical protein